MAELFASLVGAFAALLQLVAEVAQLLLEALVVLIRFLFSKSFRSRKREQWAASPRRKYSEIGLAVVCFAGLAAASTLLFTPSKASSGQGSVDLHPEKAQKGEDLRVRFQPKDTNQLGQVVVVKEGGLARIISTRSITDLVQQVKADVSVLNPRTTNSNQPIKE